MSYQQLFLDHTDPDYAWVTCKNCGHGFFGHIRKGLGRPDRMQDVELIMCPYCVLEYFSVYWPGLNPGQFRYNTEKEWNLKRNDQPASQSTRPRSNRLAESASLALAGVPDLDLDDLDDLDDYE